MIDSDSVYEDLGYMRGKMADQKYCLNKKLTMPTDKIKIEYVKGCSVGDVKMVRVDIAEDLIRRGFAVRVG